VRERRMHSSVKAGRPTRAWAAVVRGWLPRGWVIEGQSPEVPDVANHGPPRPTRLSTGANRTNFALVHLSGRVLGLLNRIRSP